MTSGFIKLAIRILDAARRRLATRLGTSDAQPSKERFVSCGKNSSVDGLSCEVRNPNSDEKRLIVGGDSMIFGRFVFETGTGRVVIGDRSFIGGGMFVCVDGIDIGNDVMISWGCTFVDNNSHSTRWSDRVNDNRDWKRGIDEGAIGRYKDWSCVKTAPIVVQDTTWVGFNCIVLKGVTIGEGAIVGAGSVVTKNIPDWVIAGGNPATVLRELSVDGR